jgi:hypothetical protein
VVSGTDDVGSAVVFGAVVLGTDDVVAADSVDDGAAELDGVASSSEQDAAASTRATSTAENGRRREAIIAADRRPRTPTLGRRG